VDTINLGQEMTTEGQCIVSEAETKGVGGVGVEGIMDLDLSPFSEMHFYWRNHD